MKTLHDRVGKVGKNISVCLTDIQGAPLGRVVNRLYDHDKLMDMAPGRTGYPYNGGQHTLTIRGSKDDVLCFMELGKEHVQKYRSHEEGIKILDDIMEIVKAY